MAAVNVTLACDHVITFAQRDWCPVRGEKVWCVRCDDYRPVSDAPHAFRAKCRVCSYSPPASRFRADADRLAEAHHKRRGHRVLILDGRVLVGAVGERLARRTDLRPVLERLYERDPKVAENFVKNLRPKS